MGGNGDALDVFHDEIGSSVLGLPRVENFGDGRVVHHGQGLSLGLETGDDWSCQTTLYCSWCAPADQFIRDRNIRPTPGPRLRLENNMIREYGQSKGRHANTIC